MHLPAIDLKSDWAEIALNVPPLNTLNHETVEALQVAFENYDSDLPLIITGVGRAFSAGVDTKEFGAYSERQRSEFFAAITAMTRSLCNVSSPVVAAVNGHAIGGGFVLLLCADYRIVADGGHKFGLTEALAGVPFPDGPNEIIKHEISMPLLRRMTLSSQLITQQELLQHGVIDEIVSKDSVLESAQKRAVDLNRQSAFSVVKTQIRGPLLRKLAALS